MKEGDLMYERIEYLCEQNHISVTKLCLEITGSKGNLSTWKKGNINSESLKKIADYFNVSTDYLLGRTELPIVIGNTQFNGENHNGIQATVNSGNLTVSTNKPELDEIESELLKNFRKISFPDKLRVVSDVMDKAAGKK